MDLRFTYHAQDKLYERDVDTSHIQDAIQHPDIAIDLGGGKTKVIKTTSTMTVVVVYAQNKFKYKSRYLIISMYYPDEYRN